MHPCQLSAEPLLPREGGSCPSGDLNLDDVSGLGGKGCVVRGLSLGHPSEYFLEAPTVPFTLPLSSLAPGGGLTVLPSPCEVRQPLNWCSQAGVKQL